jgi:hypothetical protein
MPNKLQKSREDDPHIDNNLKANMDWTKAVNCAQRTIAQYSQLILKCMAQGQCHGQGSYVWCEHPPMTNIKECYYKVLAQYKSITELMQEGQYTNDNTCWYNDFNGQRVALVRTAIV